MYNFTSLSDLVDVLGSFHGPINVRDDMREKAAEMGIWLAEATVTAEVRVMIDGPEKARSHE